MDIIYRSAQLRTACNTEKKGVRKYGSERFKIISRRLAQIDAAECLEDIRKVGGFHVLKGDRRGQIAVQLDRGYRLVFIPADDPIPVLLDGSWDLKRITSVRILRVEDYHE